MCTDTAICKNLLKLAYDYYHLQFNSNYMLTSRILSIKSVSPLYKLNYTVDLL